jgi:hypothetical protein
VGVEFSFTTPSNQVTINLRIKIDTRTKTLQSFTAYTMGGGFPQLQIQKHPGFSVTIGTDLFCLVSATNYNTLKIVLDPFRDAYQRLILNNHSFDISQYKLITGAGPADPLFEAKLEILTNNKSAQDIYLANVIVTRNEP